jgi:hypothetical protein
MVVQDPSQLDAAQAVSGLVIRELSPEEAPLHAQVAAAGFAVIGPAWRHFSSARADEFGAADRLRSPPIEPRLP